MSCCRGAAKFLLSFLNSLFMLLGAAFTAIGSYYLICQEELLKNIGIDVSSDSFRYLCIGVIVVGAFFFLVGFAGCLGALRESKCILITNSVIFVLLAVVKIAFIIIIFRKKSESKEALNGMVSQFFSRDIPHSNIGELHLLEFMGKCCGTSGPEFYLGVTPPGTVPSSCCPIGLSIPEPTCSYKDAYTIGCNGEPAINNLMERFNIIAYVAIGLVFLEVIAAFAGMFLSCSTKSHDGYYEYD